VLRVVSETVNVIIWLVVALVYGWLLEALLLDELGLQDYLGLVVDSFPRAPKQVTKCTFSCCMTSCYVCYMTCYCK
jgi:hypothetical protein